MRGLLRSSHAGASGPWVWILAQLTSLVLDSRSGGGTGSGCSFWLPLSQHWSPVLP